MKKGIIFGAICSLQSLSAATFMITSTADSGAGTLRDALESVLTTSGDATDTIDFTPIAGMTITLTANSPLPVVSSTMVAAKTVNFINGGANITLDGNGNQGLFIGPLDPAANTVVSSVSGIDFTNCISRGGNGGDVPNLAYTGGGAMGAGGGVYVSDGATVTVIGCDFSNCSAIGGAGGAILSATAPPGGRVAGSGGGGYGATSIAGERGNGGNGLNAGGGGFRTNGGDGNTSALSAGDSGGGGGGAAFNGGPTVFGSGGAGGTATTGGGGGGGSATGATADGADGSGSDGGAGGVGITGTAGGAAGVGGTPGTAGGAGATFAGGGGGGRGTAGNFAGGAGGDSTPTGCGGGGGGASGFGAGLGGEGGDGGPFGGGGGAGVTLQNASRGGNGGYLGGGGSTAWTLAASPPPGIGGFGGGGGAGARNGAGAGALGGSSIFGGGSGAGEISPLGAVGLAGADGGIGGGNEFSGATGGGGAGLGGAIFVSSAGSLTFGTPSPTFGATNTTTGGAGGAVTGGATAGGAGSAQGDDLYLTNGTVGVAGTVTLSSSLAVPPQNLPGFLPNGFPKTFTKSGTGNLILSVASRITDTVIISDGTLTVSADNQLGTGAGVTIGATATLNGVGTFTTTKTLTVAAGSTVNVDPTFTVSAPLAQGAGGSVTKTGTGVLEFTGMSTYDGGTTVSAGTLSLNGSGSLLSTGPVTNDATFDISQITTSTSIGPLSGAGTGVVALGSRTLTIDSTGASTYAGSITDGGIGGGTGGMIVKAGADVLTMTGSSTFTGGVCIGSGTLAFSGSGSFSPDGTMVNNGILDISQIAAIATVPSLSGSGTVALGSRTLQTGSADNTQYDGVIQDQPAIVGGVGGSLTKVGSGILTLTAANTFTGTSGITAGTLALSGVGAIPQATVNVDGTFDVSQITPAATTIGDLTGSGVINLGSKDLTVGTGASTAYGGTINDGGIGGGTGATFTKSGAGTLTLSGVSTYTGNTVVDMGTLAISAAGALAPQATTTVNSILDVSQVTTSTTISALAGAGMVNIGSKELISGSTDSTTFSGTINDGGIGGGTGGSFTKAGTGTMTLTGANTYTGTTSVNAGILALSGGGTIGAGTTVSITTDLDISQIAPATFTIGDLTGAGMFNLGSKALTLGTATSTAFTGAIEDGGIGGGAGASVTKVGTGTFTSSGTNTYSGGTTITTGTFALSGTGTLFNGGDVTANGTFDISQATTGTEAIATLSGAGAVALGGNTLDTTNAGAATFSGPITDGGIGGGTGGAFIKNGAGTLTLSGVNTYTGGTTVTAGILEGSSTSVQGNILNNANVTFDQVALGTYSGDMSGTGSVIKNNIGMLIMTGTNSYSGGTTVNTGCLQGNTNSLQGDITNNSCVIFDQAAAGTYAGTLTGAGMLDKNNAGTLSVTGASPAFTGTTTVNGGEFNINGTLGGPVIVMTTGMISGIGTVGDLTNSGTISPGNSIGTLNVANLVLNASSVIDNEINGAGMSDLIAATGTATIDGTLNVIFLPGVYVAGTTYTVITAAGGVAGAFSAVTENQPDFDLLVNVLPNSVILTLIPPPTILIFTGTGSGFSNPNTQSVADNINAISDAGGAADLDNNFIVPLAGQDIDVIGDALNRLQPSQFSSFYEQSVEITNYLTSMFHASSLSFCCPNQKQNIECRYENANVWMQPYTYYFRLNPFNDQIPSFRSLNAGIIAGIDGPVGENWLLGFGGVYNYDKIDWSDARGKADINSGFFSTYTEWTDDTFFVGATFLGGFDYIDTKRKIQYLNVNETAESCHFGFDFVGQIEGGAAFNHEALNLISCIYAKANYLFFHQNGTTESGADGASLRIESNTAQTFVSELGVQAQKVFYFEDGCIAPLLGFNWIYEVPITRNNFTTAFINQPVPFQVVGYDRIRNVYSFPIQLSATKKNWSLILGYTPKFGSYLFGQDGSLQINYAF